MNLSTLTDIVIGCVALACAVLYVFSRIRKQDIELLRNSNKDLRDTLDDKTKDIEQLNKDMLQMQEQIDKLSNKVKDLEDKNGSLGSLIKDALVLYFESNPKVARVIEQQ